jgi:hypothetical protein
MPEAGSAIDLLRKMTKTSHQTTDRARASALRSLLNSGEVVASPQAFLTHKSLAQIADEFGVPVNRLESKLKDVMAEFAAQEAKSRPRMASYCHVMDENLVLMDKLYNLFRLGNQRPLAAPWLQHMRSFDEFLRHFCPQANEKVESGLIHHVGRFLNTRCQPMVLDKKAFGRSWPDVSNAGAVYGEPGQWMKLPDAWVERRVLKEALQLATNGFPNDDALFVHGSGSAAMPGIAGNKAILGAQVVLERGGKVSTGEHATGGPCGHHNVYSSTGGLAASDYTMTRWFDETKVTFGISQAKQRGFNKKWGRDWLSYENRLNEGILLGPEVPFKNIVAISAPKEQETRIKTWIGQHCPHVQYVSYEAAELLKSEDMFGLLRPDMPPQAAPPSSSAVRHTPSDAPRLPPSLVKADWSIAMHKDAKRHG